MKFKKKIVIPIVSVAVAVIAAVIFVPKIVSGASSKTTTVSTTSLMKMDISNTVSVTGTVKSEDAVNVYSTLTYQIKGVNVEVGDAVREGDVLCELDTADLITKIDQQTATLNQSQAKLGHNLAIAQNNLDVEEFNQEKNYDQQLASAENALKDAESTLDARKLRQLSAQQTLTYNRKVLGDYRDTHDIDTKNYYDADYERNLKAVRDCELEVEQCIKDVEDAERKLEEAKANLNTVKVQKQETLNSLNDQVTTAQLNSNLNDQWMQIEDMKKDLDKAIIKSPVSGTITAVFASEGASGNGLLFVIEDTQKLKIDTKIKEYDIASVKVGQEVKIKSDGTGDEEFIGKVSKIAPTAVKDAKGDTVETTDVQFVTEIVVVNASNLKIGMNARLEIITEAKNDVFAVPFDAVVENENGESVVFVARPSAGVPSDGKPDGNIDFKNDESRMDQEQDGQYAQNTQGDPENLKAGGMVVKKGSPEEMTFKAMAIPVQTGMETDFYIEILSDMLREGDLIISEPSQITDGQEVALDDAANFAGARRQGGGPGGMGGAPRVRVGG